MASPPSLIPPPPGYKSRSCSVSAVSNLSHLRKEKGPLALSTISGMHGAVGRIRSTLTRAVRQFDAYGWQRAACVANFALLQRQKERGQQRETRASTHLSLHRRIHKSPNFSDIPAGQARGGVIAEHVCADVFERTSPRPTVSGCACRLELYCVALSELSKPDANDYFPTRALPCNHARWRDTSFDAISCAPQHNASLQFTKRFNDFT